MIGTVCASLCRKNVRTLCATSQLPPSLGELSASRWLELPLGLLLGLKVNDVGTQLWSLCTPCPAPGPAPDKAAHSKTS